MGESNFIESMQGVEGEVQACKILSPDLHAIECICQTQDMQVYLIVQIYVQTWNQITPVSEDIDVTILALMLADMKEIMKKA